MKMSVEDAEMLSCPQKMARPWGQELKCEGDHCMAWRWITREDPKTLTMVPTSKGYCGMAGRPE